jgi:membrane-associated phospholipid phosphatase
MIPDSVIRLIRNRLLLGAMISVAMLIAGYFLFVQTTWGHTTDNLAYYGREALALLVIDYGNTILSTVNKVTLAVTALIIFLIGMIRRSPLVAFIAIIGQGCAIVGAEVLKCILPRHALVPTDAYYSLDLQRASYPSGHTTVATSVALALILVSVARWRLWLAPLAGFMTASFSTGVFLAGWHRPSDALGGIVWSGSCMSIAAVAAVIARGRFASHIEHSTRPLIANAMLTNLVIAIAWLAADSSRVADPNADFPFLMLTFLIIAASFSMTFWFAWQLRQVDWPQAQKRTG